MNRRDVCRGPLRRPWPSTLLRQLVWPLLIFVPCTVVAAPSLPPGIAADDGLVSKGFLSVTAYGATPDDASDDTAAIQQAIDAARDHGLVTFFPAGTYRVSETLKVMQRIRWDADKKQWIQNRRQANALVGSTRAGRPILKLTDDAKGFGDPGNPKPLIWIWAQPRDSDKPGSTDPRDEQPNISFNQVLKGIDIDLRAAQNRGAVAIQHAGSQGSTIEDISIEAAGAYAGILNPPGQGGGVYNLTVQGGRYGIWADHRARYPMIAGASFRGQEIAALYWKGQSNLTLAGFVIERATAGPVIRLESRRKAYNGALTLVDGRIEVKGGLAIDNGGARSLYLRDVFAAGASTLVRSGSAPAISPAGTSWSQILEYAYAGQGSDILIDGVVTGDGHQIARVESSDGAPDPATIQARHLWPADFPTFESPGVRSVIEFGAIPGDGQDDTPAFEAALRASKRIFVPAGTFEVTRGLELGPDHHLFGAAKHLSIIQATQAWKMAPNLPIVTATPAAKATTSLSFLMIENASGKPLTLLEWTAGPGSIVRDIMGSQRPDRGAAKSAASPTYAIRGPGGGRWYGMAAEWNLMKGTTRDPSYRHLLIENVEGPLSLYGVNLERSHANPQSEVRNSRHVTIYYLKGETAENQGMGSTVLGVTNSSHFALYGFSGNAKPIGRAFIELENSRDVLLANITGVSPGPGFSAVSDTSRQPAARIDGTRVVTLFRQGDGESSQ